MLCLLTVFIAVKEIESTIHSTINKLRSNKLLTETTNGNYIGQILKVI